MSQRSAATIGVLLLAHLLALILAIAPAPALAQVHAHPDAEGTPVVRSL